MMFGATISKAVQVIVFSHELGHNFGSHHDPTSCQDSSNGNFIMYGEATSATEPNNVKFSDCSIGDIR